MNVCIGLEKYLRYANESTVLFTGDVQQVRQYRFARQRSRTVAWRGSVSPVILFTGPFLSRSRYRSLRIHLGEGDTL